MLKFNKPIRTKDGQEVVPFLMEGKKVYCFDGAKNTVIKYLSDFDFLPKMKEKKIVSVITTAEATDELHEVKSIVEEKKIIPVKEVKAEPEPEPVKEVKIEPEPELEPIPDPALDPVLDDENYFGNNDENYI